MTSSTEGSSMRNCAGIVNARRQQQQQRQDAQEHIFVVAVKELEYCHGEHQHAQHRVRPRISFCVRGFPCPRLGSWFSSVRARTVCVVRRAVATVPGSSLPRFSHCSRASLSEPAHRQSARTGDGLAARTERKPILSRLWATRIIRQCSMRPLRGSSWLLVVGLAIMAMPVVWAIVRCARWALCRLAANPSSETTE